jgi:nucleotide-binding universal stress UspA family protein
VNVLVALDLSAASIDVVAAACKYAIATKAQARVLHVAEPDPDFVGYEAGPGVVRDQVAREHREEHRLLQEHADRLRASGIDATALLIQGPIVETILKEAEKMPADLIVLGNYGHGAVYQLVAGSTCLGVVRQSTLPLLLVPVTRV